MTNEQRYKTVEERSEAFQCYCRNAGCCASCAISNSMPSFRCLFEWLALEAEEEKPLPCPCCGGEAQVLSGGSDHQYWEYVQCDSCKLRTAEESTRGAAVAKWNRWTK